ncbi:hypothetical protein [uncultured Metabacillus sp.]|uniref:hypothetical protein n=1 Tax=uncultured Metabacillus sp. TaxID=2860135 RepID=UPI00261114A3|nr:hypothetical protein [uncultured Metabacillus sp.]
MIGGSFIWIGDLITSFCGSIGILLIHFVAFLCWPQFNHSAVWFNYLNWWFIQGNLFSFSRHFSLSGSIIPSVVHLSQDAGHFLRLVVQLSQLVVQSQFPASPQAFFFKWFTQNTNASCSFGYKLQRLWKFLKLLLF